MIRSAKGHPSAGRLRWITLALAIVAAFAAFGFIREALRSRQIDRQISGLKAESEQLKAKNLELASLGSNMNSDEFLEQQARLKLDLKKAGEQVVVIKSAAPSSPSAPPPEPGLAPTPLTNPKKWWLYFVDHAAYERYVSTD